MKRAAFVVPGSLETPTGGYAYDRRMICELERLGWHIDVHDIGEGFPWPSPATLSAARTRLATVGPGRPVVVDGLALGVLPDIASELARRNSLLGLVHHPLALELGLSADQSELLRRSERTALAFARGVVVTSSCHRTDCRVRLQRADRPHYRGTARQRSVAACSGKPGSRRASLVIGRRRGAAQRL